MCKVGISSYNAGLSRYPGPAVGTSTKRSLGERVRDYTGARWSFSKDFKKSKSKSESAGLHRGQVQFLKKNLKNNT